MEIDLDRLKTNLFDCPDDRDEEPMWDSSGEEYLMINILPKCLYGEEFTVRDIDFDAFTEDDIVNLVDGILPVVVQGLFDVEKMEEHFINSPAQRQQRKRFF